MGSEDPQQTAHTEPLHTLPPGAQAAPYGREGGPGRRAPLFPPPHGKQSVSLSGGPARADNKVAYITAIVASCARATITELTGLYGSMSED